MHENLFQSQFGIYKVLKEDYIIRKSGYLLSEIPDSHSHDSAKAYLWKLSSVLRTQD